MVEPARIRNASAVLDMQGNFVKSLCARRSARMVDDVSDQTDVLVCMAILEDIVR